MATAVQKAILLAFLGCVIASTVAHEHHEELTEEEMNAPADTILWIHMLLQATVWGVLFPIGMVLGITRSRWHVPLQVCCVALQGVFIELKDTP